MGWQPTPTTKMIAEHSQSILLLQDTYPFPYPDPPGNEKLIWNYNKKIDDQRWVRPGPPANWRQLTPAKKEKWIEEETIRCFETGIWIFIKGMPVWLPPFYYFLLQWWYTKASYFDFRISQLLEEYFELFCEADPWCIGTFSFKKRRDGKTTRRMARKVWKAIQTQNGWFGLQSKTGIDARRVCWKALMLGYKRMPVFFQPVRGGMSDPKLMLEFTKPSVKISALKQQGDFGLEDIFNQNLDDEDLNTTIDWRDTTEDAYDGQQAVEIDLDEFCKWKKASALNAAYTYIQTCQLDGVKVGMIHAYSSPPEKDDEGLKESAEMWEASDYNKNKDLQAFKFYRWLTSSLDSYAGAIDKYGYCDREKAYMLIQSARKAAPYIKRKAVVRQTIMNIEEVFESVDNDVFITSPEIRKRLKYLMATAYRDEQKRTPKYIYGNLEWLKGIPFGEVYFKPSSIQEDYSWSGRLAIINMPTEGGCGNTWRTKLSKGRMLKFPPLDSEHVLGIDPYDFRRVDSPKPSMGAGVVGKCFDFYGNGGIDEIDAIYHFRPKDPTIFYMDMIKLAIFYGAWVNAESRNMGCIDYFEDNGYFEYVLPKLIDDPMKKDIKGSPTTSNMIQEICSFIEAHTAAMIETYWHEAVLMDYLEFDPQDTKKSNITMAAGHMGLGFSKRRKVHRTKPLLNNNRIATEIAESIIELYS